MSSGISCTVDVDDRRERIAGVPDSGEVDDVSPSSELWGMIRRDFGIREYFLDKRRNLLCKHVSFYRREQ